MIFIRREKSLKRGYVRTLMFPVSSAERQRLLTFSHLIFSFDSALQVPIPGAVDSDSAARRMTSFT